MIKFQINRNKLIINYYSKNKNNKNFLYNNKV